MYLSRRDRVQSKFSLGLFNIVKNSSLGLIKILILFDKSVLLRAKWSGNKEIKLRLENSLFSFRLSNFSKRVFWY